MRVAAVVSSRPAASIKEVTRVLTEFVDKVTGFSVLLCHRSVLTSRGQHRDSPVARIVEVKRLLSSLLPPEAADHEEGEQRLEEPVDGGDKGDAEEKEKESASGSERKPKKKQKRSKKDD